MVLSPGRGCLRARARSHDAACARARARAWSARRQRTDAAAQRFADEMGLCGVRAQPRLAGWAALALLALPLASTFSPPFAAPHARLALHGVVSQRPSAEGARRPRRGGAMRLQAVAADPAVLLAAAVAAGTTFEAQAPPIGTSLAVLGSTGGVLAYWWLVLVPSERRDLAKNKNKVATRPLQHALICACMRRACAL